jgi:hypothetical protein
MKTHLGLPIDPGLIPSTAKAKGYLWVMDFTQAFLEGVIRTEEDGKQKKGWKFGKPKEEQGILGLYRPLYQKKEYVPVTRITFFQRIKDTVTNALDFCSYLPFVWVKSTRGLWRLFYGSEVDRKAGSFKRV